LANLLARGVREKKLEDAAAFRGQHAQRLRQRIADLEARPLVERGGTRHAPLAERGGDALVTHANTLMLQMVSHLVMQDGEDPREETVREIGAPVLLERRLDDVLGEVPRRLGVAKPVFRDAEDTCEKALEENALRVSISRASAIQEILDRGLLASGAGAC
jgi:hypothetical protein